MWKVIAAGISVLSILGVLPLCAQSAAPADHSNRLYGRVTTTDGDVYEGFIRWDRNEASWSDILSANKALPPENKRDAEDMGYWDHLGQQRTGTIDVFGLKIKYDRDSDFPSSVESGIRFGHISSLEVLGSDRARLVLKSGQEVELERGGDLGPSVRDIVVADRRHGETRLKWKDVRTVDFMGARWSAEPASARLYGTLVTRDGRRFTGFVAWDADEALGSDVLDGDRDGHRRKIPFREIASIQRDGARGARVSLRDGDVFVLRGTNDVDHSNSGIIVADTALGEARVDWDAFDRLDLAPPPPLDFDAFGGGHPLRATVVTRSDSSYTGHIRWDNDEAYSWEMLNGDLDDGTQLSIEFGEIASVDRITDRGCRVTLRDGRTFELRGSNDVDEGNKGIYIRLSDGRLEAVWWEDLARVEFLP
ncbi:MAG TPA: hypothetical protein VJ957_10075 [Longimicrobiales bacterium]|nr:hypothetical protein [Longimicrobiales bacterium]